jgi:hypothetical protein
MELQAIVNTNTTEENFQQKLGAKYHKVHRMSTDDSVQEGADIFRVVPRGGSMQYEHYSEAY